MRRIFINLKKYYRYAIRSAKSELKSEIADSRLNWLWWIIEPLAFMLIYTFVFGYIFKNRQPYFASFVFVGLTAWEFFSRMITGSVKLISSNRDLVTKVYIPKYILLLSKSFTYLFKMGISFVILFVLMCFQHVPMTWHIIFMIPVILILYLLCFGLGMILMHFGVLLDDLSKLTNIVLKMIFYLSGIFYNIRIKLTGNLQFILLRANPIAFIMDELRKALIGSKFPSVEGLFFWFFVAIILNIVGVVMIHKNENSYAKVI